MEINPKTQKLPVQVAACPINLNRVYGQSSHNNNLRSEECLPRPLGQSFLP
jgi:hypothetical protein